MTATNASIRVICDADLLPETEKEKIQAELESTFSLSNGEARDFINGNVTFCRPVANKFIAQKYKKAFGKIGLPCAIEINPTARKKVVPANKPSNTEKSVKTQKGKISTPTPKVAVAPAPSSTAGQPTKSESANRKALRKKTALTLDITPIENEVISTPDSIEAPQTTKTTDKKSRRFIEAVKDSAIYGLLRGLYRSLRTRQTESRIAVASTYLAMLFYAITFIPSDYLANVLSVEQLSAYLPIEGLLSSLYIDATDISVRYVPLLLGTLFITLSCAFLARLKDYSYSYAMLGLAGPLGLGVTLLLPDRFHKETYKFFDKKHSIGYVLIIAGLIWLRTPMPVQTDTEPFLKQASTLAQGRSLYPSASLDNMENLSVKEKSELQEYLANGIKLIGVIGDNPEKVAPIGQAMFLEVSKFFQWVYYQRFLAYQSGKDLNVGKGDDAINLLTNTMIGKLERSVRRLGNAQLSQQFDMWFKPGEVSVSSDLQTLNTELVDMKLLFSRSGRKIDENFNLREFPQPEFAIADAKLDKNIITLTLKSNDPSVSGSSVVVAAYTRAYNRLGVLRYDIELEQIGGTLPNYLLPGQLNYFNGLTAN